MENFAFRSIWLGQKSKANDVNCPQFDDFSRLLVFVFVSIENSKLLDY